MVLLLNRYSSSSPYGSGYEDSAAPRFRLPATFAFIFAISFASSAILLVEYADDVFAGDEKEEKLYTSVVDNHKNMNIDPAEDSNTNRQ